MFWVTLLLAAVAWIRLAAGGYESPPDGQLCLSGLEPDRALCVAGQVYQKEEQKIWLQSVSVIQSDESISCLENIICEISEGTEAVPLGSRVVVSGKFALFSGGENPGEFDAAAYYRTLGVGGRLRGAEVLRQGGKYWPVRQAAFELRQFLKSRLYAVLPEKSAAAMCALLLGDRGDLDDEMKDLYKRNGILHILSISSLHITIIGMGLYKLLRKLRLPVIPAAVGGSAVLLFYGMMTGFGLSACRAIGMYLIRMFAEVIGRTYDMLTALGVMAAVMVLKNPRYLQNAGFLLSFSSVLGIGMVLPALSEERGKRTRSAVRGRSKHLIRLQKAGQELKASALASTAITLTTLPVQLWFYYEVPVCAVVINLLVLPLMKPLLASGILCLVPGLGPVGMIARVVLQWYELLCSFFDTLPFRTWNPGRPAVWQIIVYYTVLGGILLGGEWRRRQESRGKIRELERERQAERRENRLRQNGTEEKVPNRVRMRGLFRCSALTLAVILLTVSPRTGDRVLFLSVGQGDCAMVRTASGETYIFDCGSSSRSGVGEYVLLPCLKYYGIRRVDGLFLSHPDEDHMNGLLELLELAGDNQIEISQLILPAIEESARAEQFGALLQGVKVCERNQGKAISVAYLAAGEGWECGSASFVCLHPNDGCSAEDKNAYSQCIYADFGEFTLLMTGDVEGGGETALLRAVREREIAALTILKVAHHGSRYSTSEEFLDQLNPAAAVISCGKGNRYGHPHEELLDRLEKTGSRVFRTDQGGAVLVWAERGRVKVKCYIKQ